MNNKKICFRVGTDTIIEKKSRFIANVFPIKSEEEAFEYIEKIKKQYYDARHNCYAFVLDKDSEIIKYSDDGEPQGTAGKPILDILINNNIKDVLVVVTRYFGGILLGTGGLVRAYQESAKKGIENSTILDLNFGYNILYKIDYTMFGKIRYIIEEKNIHIIDIVYEDKVILDIVVNESIVDSFLEEIKELSSGKLGFLKKEYKKYVIEKNKVYDIL